MQWNDNMAANHLVQLEDIDVDDNTGNFTLITRLCLNEISRPL